MGPSPSRRRGQPGSAAADARAVCGRPDADFVPIADHRASALYRLTAANAVLHKTLTEIAGTPSHGRHRRARCTQQRMAVQSLPRPRRRHGDDPASAMTSALI